MVLALVSVIALLGCEPSNEKVQGDSGAAPIATSTPRTGKWSITRNTDPMTDIKSARLMLLAEGGKASLNIICKSYDTNVYIDWDRFLARKDGDKFSREVVIRFGVGNPTEVSWLPSADDTATFVPPPREVFVKSMRATDRLVAQVTPYRADPVTAIFDVKGLTEALASARPECIGFVPDL